MCLTGFLAELLCSAVEATEEFEQVTNVVQGIQESASDVENVKNIANITADTENSASVINDIDSDKDGKEVVTTVLATVIQANPTVSTVKNTLGAVQDYRNGEDITEIIKHRTTQVVEDQVPKIILDKAEAELNNTTKS